MINIIRKYSNKEQMKNIQEHISTLKNYKDFSQLSDNHEQLLNEQTVLLYAATLLGEDNKDIMDLCLDILENFISIERNHAELLSIFGVYEALESLAIKERSTYVLQSKRAEVLANILTNTAAPAYNTRYSVKRCKYRNNFLFLLEIKELTEKNKPYLVSIFLKTKGVISFHFHEKGRCTIRLCSHISIESFVKTIQDGCNMTVLVVVKDPTTGNEYYENILETLPDNLEYVDEESPPKDKAITAKRKSENEENSLLNSLISFWNQSFYW
ncbi:hypothetical protein HHI36_000997 [Cryptolaemus montrouzieri]|uniref:Armadillo repeat-containing protein 1 n=1 Tax=Cryptolaemus montrouzieri TaxID=559131 RepID=A0ABD2P6C0_9CUCU